MSPLFRRRLKYFLRLEYPLKVVMEDGVFSGTYPDLGVRVQHQDLVTLYARLDEERRQAITVRLEQGLTVPMPNSDGEADAEGGARRFSLFS